MPVIPTLGMLRQEDHKFKASHSRTLLPFILKSTNNGSKTGLVE
jgi:hypothetical protein